MEYIVTNNITVEELEVLENTCFEHDIYSSKQLQEILENKEMYEVVALQNNKQDNLAYLIIFDNSDSLEIMKIGVLPNQRKNGLGRVLVNYLFNKNRDVFLEVREKNEIARKFYKNLGFEVVGKRKNYYQDDGDTAIIMVKNF